MSIWHWAIVGAIVLVLAGTARALKFASRERDMTRIGGWLVVLVVWMVVLQPALHAVSLSRDLTATESLVPQTLSDPKWHVYRTWVWTVYWLGTVATFYAGLDLAASRRVGVLWEAIAAIWAAGPVSWMVIGMVLPGLVFGEWGVDAGGLGNLLSNIVVAAIWTAYLLKADRVRVRYTEGLPRAGQRAPS